jgi:hypothetical protein
MFSCVTVIAAVRLRQGKVAGSRGFGGPAARLSWQ